VRQRQRLHEPSSIDRSRRNPERADKQQPRTRHRTKLGTQWDRSGLRPTWGHFLSRSVETLESIITTIAFQQGGTAKSEQFTAHTVRPTVSAVSDPATQATPENRPFYGISRNLTSRSFQFGKCCLDTKPLMILSQVHLRKPCYDFYFL
jgi:hypothetical protein